uniref:BTB domain-containing protein n=1 Tax=Panagrolaimus sp. ES5 TaxID=591445 RepID=A0AC34G5Q4_9BILA
MKEANENKVEITDFSFDIVEKAVKLCYHRKLVSDFTTEECFSLLKFADKYNMESIQENLEAYLGERITVSNVCEMCNGAIAENLLKLQNYCMDFVLICLSKKELVPNMELLEKDFFIAAITNLSCQKSQSL